MKQLVLASLLILLVSGCATGKLNERSDEGLCDGLAKPIDQLNDALLEDGGPKSLVAGENVIAGFDGGCEK
jgi:hypothetical protein